jgi:hypothetical protein
MADSSDARYVRSADGTNLACYVSGEGPLELVFLTGGPFPIDLLSEDPAFIGVRRRLGAFSRTVWSDRRGQGASEGDPRDSPPGQISNADLTAVLDAVGFERSALVAEGAKRVCDLARPGQVLVSETVRTGTVGAGIPFTARGEHELKGVPGTWRLFSVDP